MISSTVPRAAAALLACLTAVACSSDGRPRTGGMERATAAAKVEDSSAGTIDLGGGSYEPRALSAMGSIAGTVTVAGPAPGDTMTEAKARAACRLRGAADLPDQAATANTIVWIADPGHGKPLPVEKRTEIQSDDCMLDPSAQAIVVGTTVNVFNDDKALHRLVFTHVGQHDTLTVMPFFNTGQVVASERLAKTPGVVEVRCANHPWMHAYLVVLDHPYFDVTDDRGGFKIDSIAPGNYQLMIWRPGLAKPVEQRVQVAANGTAHVTLTIDRASAQQIAAAQ